MLRKFCALFLLIVFFCSGACADTVTLKNGKTFEGDIHEFMAAIRR
ncbi:MAG: hypothetical protein K8S27_00240 [Candidatus Omnitrophica bacterium]|nr:hypothetical protein [Candidatus Omnitrophota bacterium]